MVTQLALLLSTLGISSSVRAEENLQYQNAPKIYEFLPNAFSDVPKFLSRVNPIDNWKEYLEILSLTGVLIATDQETIDGSQYYAKRMHLITEHDNGGGSKVIWSPKIRGISADLRLPTGPNSYLYFIGDGLTSLSILGGMAVFGGIATDMRALNTASQTMESLVLTGMFVVSGKYLSGRESPFRATERGGAWRPAPGVRTYLETVSKHDAFPSGHVATVMSTVTIIHLNYPEKTWVIPVGYSALGLLMFGMLNNGVHWAGDYPVGIAIGYVAAMTVFAERNPAGHTTPTAPAQESTTRILPFASAHGFGVLLEMKT
jgi:membrane-associated phospholipid phosphatase